MISIRYRIISPHARVPTKGTLLSAAYDIYSSEDVIIYKDDTVPVHTGLILQPQQEYYIHVYPRSGMAKAGISIANAPGIIDADYSNELLVLLHNHSKVDYHVAIGHRIAQIMALPINELRFVESVNLINKHGKGFGSTGQ